jgi:isoleucyl-tRNA synthetase
MEKNIMKYDFQVNVAKSNLSVGHTHNDQQMLDLWEKHQVFNQTNMSLARTGQDKFVLLDGPPYANGQAHMGHALNKLFKDLVVKSQWFMGHPVDYRPGWDCHGLPLELAVEKRYGKLDTPTLKKRCQQLAFRSLVKQRKSFKRLGVLGKWNEPYLTLSKPMLKQGWNTMKTLFDKNLLEYKQYPVHYCPACASSLAEAELENKVSSKDSLYFKMQLVCPSYQKPCYALVWTTTPWTLPMNQALAYHEDFTYELWSNEHEQVLLQNAQHPYVASWLESQNLVFEKEVQGATLHGQLAQSPLTHQMVPLLAASFVEEGKTGFVHMALAHGPEDFELGVAHGLQPHSYLNSHGVFVFDESHHLANLNGKKHHQVQALVCEHLGLNNLLVDYRHEDVEQQVCWRHKCGVYYNATWQVFLKLQEPSFNLKQKVRDLLASSELNKHYQQRLEQMLLGRAQWCLSRQRRWGCPMNLLVDKKNHQLSPLSSQYLELLAQEDNQQAAALLEQNPHLYVFEDVVDVWFDSGNVVNEYYSRNDENRAHAQSKGYVVNLALEGKDQFRGWFQSLLWLSVAVNEVMPYQNLFCHGFVLDEARNKFSKSAGNGSLVEAYADHHGADVLHLWVASQEPEMDAVFSEKKLEEMKRYYSRLRLSLRFLTSNLYDYNYSQHANNWEHFSQLESFDVHRYVLKEMARLYRELSDNFSQFQFRKSLEALYLFCDRVLSNFYFDYVKNPLYLKAQNSDFRQMTQCALYEVLLGVFDMVKVFCPFVAEEFYQDFYSSQQEEQRGSVFYSHYFNRKNVQKLDCLDVKVQWDEVNELRKEVQAQLEPLQKAKQVKSRTEVSVHLSLPEPMFARLVWVEQHYRLSDLLSVSDVTVELCSTNMNMNSVLVSLQDLKLDASYAKCPRCWNHEVFSRFVNYQNNENDDVLVCEHCYPEMVAQSQKHLELVESSS